MKMPFRVPVLFFLMATNSGIFAQGRQTENLIIVTLDGMRWQEVFKGADEALLNNSKYTHDSAFARAKFWSDDVQARRKKLFPFIWSEIAGKGQIYGNRKYDNDVNNANPYKFSYPGYNEIFTGYPDPAVNSNDKILNKNTNVLGFINQQPGYQNKVAAFTTWDVFPYILNKWKSGIYVNSDTDTLHFDSEKIKLINDIQFLTTRPLDVRPDVLTYIAAREYLKAYQPKVLYIAFDETDDFAHGGDYDQYLGSAHAEDGMLADLWNYIQTSPNYKNKTTMIVASDHGRGDADKNQWRDHGEKVADAGHIWIAAIGPDTKPLGEIKTPAVLYQKQLAATFAALLGFTFIAEHPVALPIESIYTTKNEQAKRN
jgi:hypothetical protein